MDTTTKKPTSAFYLFLATFLSAFLIFFGVGLLLLLFFPQLVTAFSPTISHQTLLPVAEDREEGFLEIGPVAGKQLYPSLTEVTTVQEGNWIRIPSIGVNVPLVLSNSLEDKDIIESLKSGVALYPNGIEPGHLGNTFIAAHSTGNPWHGPYRFAFSKINQVENGHVIHLDYQGTRYTYRVVDTQIIKPSPDYRVISDRPIPTVTLMACWPLWSTDKRMLKTAELTNITKLTPQPA
jgi:LPXTG-site transpeptidase (sortase) family protein